jgi:ABC-type glycerol-3-phosphate transport system permease component
LRRLLLVGLYAKQSGCQGRYNLNRADATLLLGLPALNGRDDVEYDMILVGATIVTLPVIALFVARHKQFIAGLTIGAVKG